MEIWKYLRVEHIFLNVLIPDKKASLRFIANVCVQSGLVEDDFRLYEGLLKREQTMSTGVGDGLGFPHTFSREANDATIILIRLAEPIDFEALDALPVDVILAMIVPENETTLHLQLLAGVSRLCKSPEFLEAVRKATRSKDLWYLIKELEDSMPFH
jgi:mannitol/fructose-specific phosphotransferase system IIA component (Ntr-type)